MPFRITFGHRRGKWIVHIGFLPIEPTDEDAFACRTWEGDLKVA